MVSAVHAASIRVVNSGQEVRLEVGIKKIQIDYLKVRIWVWGQGRVQAGWVGVRSSVKARVRYGQGLD